MSRHRALLSLLMVGLWVSTSPPLHAKPPAAPLGLEARETAHVHDQGWMSVGVLDPFRWAVADGVELQTHPLMLIGSPNLRVRMMHWHRGPYRLTAEYGLFFPSPAFRLAPPLGLAGYLTPACKVADADPSQAQSCHRPGWHLVPNAGLLFSWGERHVLTAKLDAAVGIVLAGRRGRPLDTWTPLDLKLAPVFNIFRIHLGVRYDRQLLRWWRLAARLDLWIVGQGPEPKRDPWVLSAWIGTDFALGRYTRLTVGVVYYNSDQRRTVLRRDADGFGVWKRVRSHDFYPTIDAIWAWSI